jgi:adenosylhomocysteine nucleosidase
MRMKSTARDGRIAVATNVARMNPTVVVGLRAEARLARGFGVPVAIGGGTASGAAAAVARAVAEGASALLSFGLAGGLDPAARPGLLLVPASVLCDGRWHAADPALMAWLGGATPHRLLAADAPAIGVADKRRLWQDTGATALDLETGAVVREAVAHRLPFGVLRAVCDPAEQDLPHAALVALDARGSIGLARVAWCVARRPRQVPALLRLAADAAAARRMLARRVREVADAS